MQKRTKTTATLLSLLSAALIAVTLLLAFGSVGAAANGAGLRLWTEDVASAKEQLYDGTNVFRLPSSVSDEEEISVIIRTGDYTLMDAHRDSGSDLSFGEYSLSEEAEAFRAALFKEKEAILATLGEKGIAVTPGAEYDTVLSGFEVILTAKDFKDLCLALPNSATPIVGEVYKPAESQLVENKVNVYDTGIFDSSEFGYDGAGTVVAVLDTGLDYRHTAFSLSNFHTPDEKLALTFSRVEELLGDTVAAKIRDGLSASDVYVSKKIPFGFDYADGDPDVYPIQNDHGTHVSGIIAGDDDTITGVAPGAQIVSMKIFSDVAVSARSSWILTALEDCVVLGVDVINMSIGTGCGFSRETDKEALSGVYDRIREAGISMVVAASNSFSSAYNSEKNGNLPLTSNPDSATVGSPSTYEGALSIASINGAGTPYLLFGDRIVYFLESSDRVSEEKNFVEDLLPEGVFEKEYEFILISGAGRAADYTGVDVTGKIVLVERGSSTFEEKANVAQSRGAAALIVYNNVSGDIKMNVGDTTMAVCSISRDDGRVLAEAGSGRLKISRSQTSGPFMSDFSSWGPTPDLKIKPELTAHGGSILSSVPGQSYDRISGTSMACPNVSGVVALMRQYVKESFPEIKNDPVKVAATVNRLLMSTADVAYGPNGLPYAVRKQGAGLANIFKAGSTRAVILTGEEGRWMDKSKIELGDDPEKRGVYNLKFSVENFGDADLSFTLRTTVLTEGVSETKTRDGKTTVTEQGYLLEAPITEILTEGGEIADRTLTVKAGTVASFRVVLTLTEADKKYLDDSFANGSYVEGFVHLDGTDEETVDLSCPFLAFYGDWTQAPIFDLDYFATNKDELDDGIDLLDKTLPDAYATRPVGGLYEDYVAYLGSYHFDQNPSAKKIAADRKYISLSNQADAVNSLRFVWAGLLRNAARMEITVTEDATGLVVYERTETMLRKSYGDGGPIYPANVDIEFSAIEEELANNSSYTVRLEAFLDYGDGGVEKNASRVFEFPLVADFEAPAITDCEFYTEYDRSEKKTRLFAKLSVYDNHYSMAANVGYVGMNADRTGYEFKQFDRYATPIYSEFNDTTYVIVELTDHVDEIMQNDRAGCFSVAVFDYALNEACFEIELPDEFVDFRFAEEELVLSPNELYDLSVLVYPETEWPELLEYTATNPGVARVVDGKLVTVAPGKSVIFARDPVTKKNAQLNLTVLGEGDEGYVRYDRPVTDHFELIGYLTNKAYYFLDSAERDIGLTGDERKFVGNSASLSLYPSESVTLRYELYAYFPDSVTVTFESSNEDIVKVSPNGTLTAMGEGFASVSLQVYMDGKMTFYSKSVSIEVKEPWVTSGPSLSHYFGNGGRVIFPSTLHVTEIGQYAFSNFDYVPKDPWDEISEDSPEATKIWYIGDDTVTEVVIPEGVKTIGPFAFANLTALKKVTLPSTLERIDQGAFLGCTALSEVVGLEHVKFINQSAFENCNLMGEIAPSSAVAIADNAFRGNGKLTSVLLSEETVSLGIGAFENCTALTTLTSAAEKVKLGERVFAGCKKLAAVRINADVIPTHAFDGCESLAVFTVGKNVAVIGEYAFRGTVISAFLLDEDNETFALAEGGRLLLSKDGARLVLIAPRCGKEVLLPATVTVIGQGAAAGNRELERIDLSRVTRVEDCAFADCAFLSDVTFGTLSYVGKEAFRDTRLATLPSLEGLSAIGDGAFRGTHVSAVTIPDGVAVGSFAFYDCTKLTHVEIGDNVTVGAYAFATNENREGVWQTYSYTLGSKKIWGTKYVSPLTSLVVGDGVILGNSAFRTAACLTSVTLGEGTVVGDYAFYNASSLETVDLSRCVSIGAEAFSGDVLYDSFTSNMQSYATDEEGNYLYSYMAPILVSADLSALEKLGEGAFAFARRLTSVKLGEGLTEIDPLAFFGCHRLVTVNLGFVTFIGDNAFADTALTLVELPLCGYVGEYAFARCPALEKVVLGAELYEIGEAAFTLCEKLTRVEGLGECLTIGDYAFALTALTEADLAKCISLGKYAFFKETPVPFAVTLGGALKTVGDNPFAGCLLAPFSRTETVEFNGKTYEKTVLDFDLSPTVTVLGGSLYARVPRGLVLITYASGEERVTVEDGTVRIGAYAFAGSNVTEVILPVDLAAIGHKAFYGCDSLLAVCFSSFDAPILEEEYDPDLFYSGEFYPCTGDIAAELPDGTPISLKGLEIVPFFMWNVTDLASNVYYGATFLDYVGRVDRPLLMIRPENGKNYESFIFSQYFTSVMDGAAAPDGVTLAAIRAISALPDTVKLKDRAQVEEARMLYDKISTTAQRALVTEYSRLTEAEKRIKDLEFLENDNTPTVPDTPDPLPTKTEDPTRFLLVLLGVFGGLAAAEFLFLAILRKRSVQK